MIEARDERAILAGNCRRRSRIGDILAEVPVLAVLVALAAFVVLALAAPERTAGWLAKEGPVEHASHVILALAALAWLALAIFKRSAARLLSLALALFLALVLAEELDWGAVYGWRGPGEAIARVFGHRNLHNAASGSSYLLFAVPLAVYFAWPRAPLTPTRHERRAFVLLAAAFLACNLTPWERHGQELLEALLYALMLAVAARLLRPDVRAILAAP